MEVEILNPIEYISWQQSTSFSNWFWCWGKVSMPEFIYLFSVEIGKNTRYNLHHFLPWHLSYYCPWEEVCSGPIVAENITKLLPVFTGQFFFCACLAYYSFSWRIELSGWDGCSSGVSLPMSLYLWSLQSVGVSGSARAEAAGSFQPLGSHTAFLPPHSINRS